LKVSKCELHDTDQRVFVAEEGLVRKSSGSSTAVPQASRLESFLSGELPANAGATVMPMDAAEENHLEMALLSLESASQSIAGMSDVESGGALESFVGAGVGMYSAGVEHSQHQTEQTTTQSTLISSQTAPLDLPSATSQRAPTHVQSS
jgi:hypothetical protein